jgi:LPXTG-motif cell wall-anchored protein
MRLGSAVLMPKALKGVVRNTRGKYGVYSLIKACALRLILVLAVFGIVLAANICNTQYVVPLKSGDWIRYDIDVTYLGQTFQGSIELTIQYVQGTLITGTYELTTGGQSIVPPEQFTLDISTGVGQSARGFIVPANLTVGDFIPGESANVLALTDWRGRKAIVANASSPYLGFASQVYWDQTTGVLLETRGSVSGQDFSIVLAETSLWTGGLSLMWLIVIGVVVVVAVLALLLRRRKSPRIPPMVQQTEPPPPPPPQPFSTDHIRP